MDDTGATARTDDTIPGRWNGVLGSDEGRGLSSRPAESMGKKDVVEQREKNEGTVDQNVPLSPGHHRQNG